MSKNLKKYQKTSQIPTKTSKYRPNTDENGEKP